MVPYINQAPMTEGAARFYAARNFECAERLSLDPDRKWLAPRFMFQGWHLLAWADAVRGEISYRSLVRGLTRLGRGTT